MSNYFKGEITCINVLNKLSLTCNCDLNAGSSSMDDIIILAFRDLIVLEKVSLGLVKM